MNKKTEFVKSGNLQVIEIGGETFFSSAEVAKRLGWCAGTFYNAKKKYNLVGVMVGRRKYYNEKELTRAVFGSKFQGK
jgi:hypothetical protein